MGTTAGFAGYHPWVLCPYFLLVFFSTVVFWHPLFLICSLIGGLGYGLLLGGGRAAGFAVKVALPIAAAAMLFNMFFNHQGLTTLFTWRGHTYTLEALRFGGVAAAIFFAMLLWCYCFGKVMTGEKIMALFGNGLPHLALLTAMVLRGVPRYHRQFRQVAAAQNSVEGSDMTRRGNRLQAGIRRLSMVTTWALEGTAVTADTMQARGYGQGRRTTYVRRRWEMRDTWCLLAILVVAGLVVLGGIHGIQQVYYYPLLQLSWPKGWSWAVFAGYGGLCLLPLLLQGREVIRWRKSSSKD